MSIQGSAPRLRLNDVLSFLHGPGQDVAQKLVDELGPYGELRRKDVQQEQLDGYLKRHEPRDPFLRAFAERLVELHPPLRRAGAAAAITTMLASVADADGSVDVQAAGAKLGGRASAVLLQIAERIGAAGVERSPLPKNHKYLGMDFATAVRVGKSAPPTDLAARMPLLAEMTRMWEAARPLEGWGMCSLGHLFATTPALYEALEHSGLRRDAHLVTGKGYSRHPDVIVRMAGEGFRVDEALLHSYEYEKNVAMEEKRAVAQLRKLFEGVDPNDRDKRFLLLDEGGYLTVALHEHAELRPYAPMCRAVEQTAHGIKRIKEHILDRGEPLLVPVVDAARSELKRKYESPMIGEAVVSSAERALAAAHPALQPRTKEAAIAGFGHVGPATAEALVRRGFKREDIWVYDADPAKLAKARELGFSTGTREEVLRHGSWYFSATGSTTITPDELHLLPAGAIAVNAGSGQHELGMNLKGLHSGPHVSPLEDDRRFRGAVGARRFDTMGERVRFYTGQALDLLQQRRVPVRRLAVLGYDDDGRCAIDHLLERGFSRAQIAVHDPDPARLEQARAAGHPVGGLQEVSRGATVALTNHAFGERAREVMTLLERGAAFVNYGALDAAEADWGRDSLPRSMREAHKTSTEWDEDGNWYGHFRGMNLALGEDGVGKGYRHRILRTGEGNEVLVLRGGFVINMTTGIVPEYSQLILAMLQACCLQATQENEPGIVTMRADTQAFIERRMRKHLERSGRSLEEPRFEGLADAVY